MEDKRNIQIAENKFPLIEGTEQQIFLRTTYINYLNFSEGLAAQFFTGRDIEVQHNILQNNFSLTDEDINSWGPRASQGFATAEHSTADKRNMLATSIAEHVTSMDLKQQKIEEIQKAKKRYLECTPEKEKSKTGIKHRFKKDKKKKKKTQHHDSDSDFTYQYGSDSDDLLDQTINELMEKAADEIISIDQPIVDPMKMIKSGINLDNSPNVDQSSKMEIVTDTPIMKQIEKTPMLQAISQSQNIIMDLTKSSNKKKKSNKNLVQQAITGHIPTDEGTLRVRDILQPTRSQGNNTNKNQRTSGSQQTQKKQQNSSKNSKKKPQETKSDKKSKKDKKDKFRKVSRSKVLRKL
ncbi:uncharacterized protein OCT59_027453 [Rhizophagus irregularis]|uniref:uncharacterized protein n=1 Tax=Rhizophagus irregularis TaxID=588596 RepID=UPI003319CEDC|nr:hypothetical protein OCT59_027453 [Rhizophagus irregularis]